MALHDNFTPDGRTSPSFPDGVTPDHSLNGVSEWTFGVTPWFEAAAFLPLYSHDKSHGWQEDGLKARVMFAVPHGEERHFSYATNVELSLNTRQWDEHRLTSEIRPVLAWHFSRVDLFLNPIVEIPLDDASHTEFEPATRLAYHATRHWAVGVEEYANLGPLSDFEPLHHQSHRLFGVVDYEGPIALQVGLGFGLNEASDHLQVKAIVAKRLGSLRHSSHHTE